MVLPRPTLQEGCQAPPIMGLKMDDFTLRNVTCFLVKDWGAVERTWALELDTPGSITHMPPDLRQVLSLL